MDYATYHLLREPETTIDPLKQMGMGFQYQSLRIQTPPDQI